MQIWRESKHQEHIQVQRGHLNFIDLESGQIFVNLKLDVPGSRFQGILHAELNVLSTI